MGDVTARVWFSPFPAWMARVWKPRPSNSSLLISLALSSLTYEENHLRVRPRSPMITRGAKNFCNASYFFHSAAHCPRSRGSPTSTRLYTLRSKPMSSSKAFMPQSHTKLSSPSSLKRAALAFVALLATLAALAAAPAFAADEVIINAGLAGAAINGQTPSGKAVFRERPGNDLKLEVEVEDVTLAAGTVLNVLVGGQPIGTLTINTLRAGQLELETERGQAVPAVTNGNTVAVRHHAGANIVNGTFGSAAATPTPNASPTPGATPSPTPSASPTPTPGATPSPTPVMNEFEAKLSGAPR